VSSKLSCASWTTSNSH